MKLAKGRLQEMIKEEISKVLKESSGSSGADSAADAAIESLSASFDFENPETVDEFHPALSAAILSLLKLHAIKPLRKKTIFDDAAGDGHTADGILTRRPRLPNGDRE